METGVLAARIVELAVPVDALARLGRFGLDERDLAEVVEGCSPAGRFNLSLVDPAVTLLEHASATPTLLEEVLGLLDWGDLELPLAARALAAGVSPASVVMHARMGVGPDIDACLRGGIDGVELDACVFQRSALVPSDVLDLRSRHGMPAGIAPALTAQTALSRDVVVQLLRHGVDWTDIGWLLEQPAPLARAAWLLEDDPKWAVPGRRSPADRLTDAGAPLAGLPAPVRRLGVLLGCRHGLELGRAVGLAAAMVDQPWLPVLVTLMRDADARGEATVLHEMVVAARAVDGDAALHGPPADGDSGPSAGAAAGLPAPLREWLTEAGIPLGRVDPLLPLVPSDPVAARAGVRLLCQLLQDEHVPLEVPRLTLRMVAAAAPALAADGGAAMVPLLGWVAAAAGQPWADDAIAALAVACARSPMPAGSSRSQAATDVGALLAGVTLRARGMQVAPRQVVVDGPRGTVDLRDRAVGRGGR